MFFAREKEDVALVSHIFSLMIIFITKLFQFDSEDNSCFTNVCEISTLNLFKNQWQEIDVQRCFQSV